MLEMPKGYRRIRSGAIQKKDVIQSPFTYEYAKKANFGFTVYAIESKGNQVYRKYPGKSRSGGFK